jgi:two-component sensor histidine kinase
MDKFLEVLSSRIQSMANAHALLSRNRWQGVSLADLVRDELAPFAATDNTTVEGADVALTAEATQTVAMVVHELVTNATKYGALSTPQGRVSVRWSHRRNGHAQSWLSIRWEERGGPNVVPPTQSGYGTRVIRDLIPYELGGTVDLVHAPEGVCCNLEIPAHWLSSSKPLSDSLTDLSLRH